MISKFEIQIRQAKNPYQIAVIHVQDEKVKASKTNGLVFRDERNVVDSPFVCQGSFLSKGYVLQFTADLAHL